MEHAAGKGTRRLRRGQAALDSDQVARWEQFKAGRPDAEYAHRAPAWTGSLTVCRRRREVSRTCLADVLDALDGLAAMDAEAAAIEADYPGWRVWLSDLDRWWATRQGSAVWSGGRRDPITLNADDAAGLRAQLAEATELADATS